MANDKKLIIIKGEEFKISIKERIDDTDIFYEQYLSAARMLDSIVANQKSAELRQWCKSEVENNIIAFCGERGEGKSSAMISFVNAAYKCDREIERSIFADCENVKRTYFAEPIVIDPSMLDGVHNVLDIVLATLYRKFQDQYEEDNRCLERHQRESLLDQFQKVYRCISLINNQTKMLDDEYDYEGNIGKLSKLGESTRLRNEVERLIGQYLELMPGSRKEGKVSGCLLVAIDDLDLCSSNAYKMAEQIRKYLVIPKVVIVMAIKIEQLDLCVKEQNLKNYKNIIQLEMPGKNKQDGNGNNGSQFGKWESGLLDEVNGMSERYVAKLIPRARRNYLPNVQMMHNISILYQNRNGAVIYDGKVCQTMNETLLGMIYEKTGMKFLTNKTGENCLLPDNLRDTVNIIVLLSDMMEPSSDEVYCENIQKFCLYFEKEWLFGNLDLQVCKEIQKLIYEGFLHLHEGAAFVLRKFNYLTEKKYFMPSADFLSETNDSYWSVMSWLEYFKTNVFGGEAEKYAYAFHILYTVRLNEMMRRHAYNQISELLGGYLWAGNFANMISNVQGSGFSRSRFMVPTGRAYELIVKYLDMRVRKGLSESQGQYYTQKIAKEDMYRNDSILSWILLGMLSNTYSQASTGQTIYMYSLPVISDNYAIVSHLHISIENYLVSLCNLKSLYHKLNMELLGVEEEEFNRIISKIEAFNMEKIEAIRWIIANVDLTMEFKEFCSQNRGSKEGTGEGNRDDLEISVTAIDRFFRNASLFVENHFHKKVKFDPFIVDNGKPGRAIRVSRLYAQLIREGMMYHAGSKKNANSMIKQEELRIFVARLRERINEDIPVEAVSSYMTKRTAENTKKQLDRLASNIQRYYSIHSDERLEEPEIMELCNLYGKVLDLYVENPVVNISDEIYDEYRRVYSKYHMTCR